MYTWLRQTLFPKAFRIARLPIPGKNDSSESENQKTVCNDTRGQVPRPPQLIDDTEDVALIAEVATGLWRIKRKVQPLGDAAGPGELRAVCRHVESTLDVIANREVEIRDDTGSQYVPGMALKVVAFQPTEGVVQETICEMIRPSVYYRGGLIQRGEVVVATPKSPDVPIPNSSPQDWPEPEPILEQRVELAAASEGEVRETTESNNGVSEGSR